MVTPHMNLGNKQAARLSDRILFALELALEQNDLMIAETLAQALEIAMTRNAGGGEFVERREYPVALERALQDLSMLRDKHSHQP